MTLLEFETVLEDDLIRVPEEVAAQLAKGALVHVSISPAHSSSLTSDEAWKGIVAVIEQRMAMGGTGETYTWQRDDAYEHLEDRHDPHRAD